MQESLSNALRVLKDAKAAVKRPARLKKASLFGDDMLDGVEFNGFQDVIQFRAFLFSLLAKCKIALDAQVNARALVDPSELIRELHLLYYDIKVFKSEFFPKGRDSLILQRVVLEKTPLIKLDDAILKATLLVFLNEQSNLLGDLKKLFKHRIRHLEDYYGTSLPDLSLRPVQRPARGQLALFPDDQDTTLLHWTGTKVEFAEVFEALLMSGSVSQLGEGKPSREDYFALMKWVFNYPAENIGAIIRSARKRKIENAPFLLKLVGVFKGTTSLDS